MATTEGVSAEKDQWEVCEASLQTLSQELRKKLEGLCNEAAKTEKIARLVLKTDIVQWLPSIQEQNSTESPNTALKIDVKVSSYTSTLNIDEACYSELEKHIYESFQYDIEQVLKLTKDALAYGFALNVSASGVNGCKFTPFSILVMNGKTWE